MFKELLDQKTKPVVKTKYLEFIDKKSSWKPSKLSVHNPSTYEIESGAYDTVKRAIALALVLEIPVGEYAVEGSEGLFYDQQYALVHNAADEEVHFEAFKNLAESYQVSDELVNEASDVASWFIDRQEFIFTAGFTELGIFFPSLAILRKYINSYGKGIIADVSRDENTHVRTNWSLIDDHNLLPSSSVLKSFNRNRKDVISWLTNYLSPREQIDFLQLSNKLIGRKEIDQNVSYTKAAIMPAFFELGYNPTRYG